MKARAASLLVLWCLANLVSAQNSQFTFDSSGSLSAQSVETVALPQIVGQPQMRIVIPGESASFSVVVADTRGVSYQWLFNSSAISGATGDALVLTNVSTTNQGVYSVTVSNVSGSTNSSNANLYIDADGDGLPDSWELAHFGNLSQTATGDPDGDGVSNLQEFLDGTDPTNALSVLYRISLINDGGNVAILPNQASYTKGQVVTLTATGSSADPFHAWTGDVVTRSNSITVTMTTNLNLFAHFLPFMLTWTNTSAGNWSVAANWTPNLAPSTNESVLIANAVGVILNYDVDLVNLTLGALNVGPDLNGSGKVTVSGVGTWVSGSMSGSGATIVRPGATFTIPNVSTVSLNGRVFENQGTTYWMNGGLLGMNASIITNDAGALFQVMKPSTFNYQGGVPRFDNTGAFLTATNGTTGFSAVQFNNYGNVPIQGGMLQMGGGGYQTGTITVPAGTTVNFSGGVFNCTASSSIIGAGTFLASATTANFAGTVVVTASNSFSAGTASFTGNYTCTNNTLLDISTGGAVNFDGTGTVSPNILNLNGGLGGANTVTVGSAMYWYGGTMYGSGRTTIQPAATLTIAAFTGYGGVYLADRTLENKGQVVWGGGNLNMSGVGVITNDAGASFQILNTASFGYGGGVPRFENVGTFRPSATGTTSLYNILFNNSGAINILGGTTLSMGGGGSFTGTITVPAGATLNFAGGTYNCYGGSSITGAGTLWVSSGTANLGGTVNVTGTNSFSGGTANVTGNYTCINNTLLDISIGGAVNFDGTGTVAPNTLNLNGALGGGNTVMVGSAMYWYGGSMSGSGRTIIQPAATLSIPFFAGYGGVYLYDRTLENKGAMLWAGGNFGMTGVLTNDPGGFFQIQGTAAFGYQGGAPRFDNAGTFLPSSAGGTTSFYTIAFNNYGAINLIGGILALYGPYSCTSNSALGYFIGGKTLGANYGQLQVSGSVNLNGTLNVNLTNHYVPTTNDSFTLVSAGTRNGTFANFIYPSNNVSLLLSNTTTSVIVRVEGVTLQQTNPLSLPPGNISWWRAENDAMDAVGTNNGALTNGTTFAVGKAGQSFLLDGINDYVVIPDSPSLHPASVTLEAWVLFNATNGFRLIMGKPVGSGNLDSFALWLADGVINGVVCDSVGGGPVISFAMLPVIGQWYHLAYTYSGSTLQQVLYVNGVVVASGTGYQGAGYDSHPMLIGSDIDNGIPDGFFSGQIDEASLYNRALGANEIASIYNVGAAGKQLVVASPPILHLDRIAPATALLYWSTNYPTVHLEYNTSLGTTNWAASLKTPVVTGTNFVVTNSAIASQRFYRLSSVPAPFTPPPPSLTLQRLSSTTLRLLWPADADRPFNLVSKTNLTTGLWAAEPSSPAIVGTNNVVTNTISGAQQFYRLSSP